MDRHTGKQHQRRHPDRAEMESAVRIRHPIFGNRFLQQYHCAEEVEPDDHGGRDNGRAKESPQLVIIDKVIVTVVNRHNVLKGENTNNAVSCGQQLQKHQPVRQ